MYNVAHLMFHAVPAASLKLPWMLLSSHKPCTSLCCAMQSLRCFFIEPANGIFSHPTVYGRADDAARFEFFCKVSMLHPSLLASAAACYLCRASRV